MRYELSHSNRNLLIGWLLRYSPSRILIGLLMVMIVAKAFKGQIPGNCEQKSPYISPVSIPTLRVPEYGEKAVLRDVLCEVCPTNQSINKPIHGLVVIVECLFRSQLGSLSGITVGSAKGYGTGFL